MSLIKRIILSLLLCLTFATIAQETTPEAPFIYYYSHIYNGWIIERADGTDGYLFGVDVMPRTTYPRIYHHSWSPSGEWLMWIGRTEGREREMYFARLDDKKHYHIPINIYHVDENNLVWLSTEDYLMIQSTTPERTDLFQIFDLEANQFIFERENNDYVGGKWVHSGFIVKENIYNEKPSTVEYYLFDDNQFHLDATMYEDEGECFEYLHHISDSGHLIYYCEMLPYGELVQIRIEAPATEENTVIEVEPEKSGFIWSSDGMYAYLYNPDTQHHRVFDLDVLSIEDGVFTHLASGNVHPEQKTYEINHWEQSSLWMKDTHYLLYRDETNFCRYEANTQGKICIPVTGNTDRVIDIHGVNHVYTADYESVVRYDFLSEDATVIHTNPVSYFAHYDVSQDGHYLIADSKIVDLDSEQELPEIPLHSAEAYHWGAGFSSYRNPLPLVVVASKG